MFQRLSAIFILSLGFALSMAPLALASVQEQNQTLQAAFIPTNPPAPIAVLFKNDKGEEQSLKDFKGRYVLLNIWATWCVPCIKEMPSLDRLADSLANALASTMKDKPLTILALVEDRQAELVAPPFVKRHSWSHVQFVTDTDSAAMWNLHLRGLPTTILINPQGLEMGRIYGDVDWMEAENVAFVQKLMKP